MHSIKIKCLSSSQSAQQCSSLIVNRILFLLPIHTKTGPKHLRRLCLADIWTIKNTGWMYQAKEALQHQRLGPSLLFILKFAQILQDVQKNKLNTGKQSGNRYCRHLYWGLNKSTVRKWSGNGYCGHPYWGLNKSTVRKWSGNGYCGHLY
jgi:hypothetical protein